MKRQSELLQHTTTIYLNPQIALYAKELTDRLPGNLKVTISVCIARHVITLWLALPGTHSGSIQGHPCWIGFIEHSYRGCLVLIRAELARGHVHGQGWASSGTSIQDASF